MTYRYSIVSTNYNMSVRIAPNTANSPIGSLARGVTGYGDELTPKASNGDQWLKIMEGGTAQGYVAVVYNGITYCTLTDNGIIINPPTTPIPEILEVYDIVDGVRQPVKYYDLRK